MEILIAILLFLLALAKVLARGKMHRVIFEDGSRGYIRTSELIDILDEHKQ